MIVILPAPLVIAIPVSAVKVDFVKVPPVVLPINSCPLVYVVCPVPPLAIARVPALILEAF